MNTDRYMKELLEEKKSEPGQERRNFTPEGGDSKGKGVPS